jgi:hypothetical protein
MGLEQTIKEQINHYVSEKCFFRMSENMATVKMCISLRRVVRMIIVQIAVTFRMF